MTPNHHHLHTHPVVLYLYFSVCVLWLPPACMFKALFWAANDNLPSFLKLLSDLCVKQSSIHCTQADFCIPFSCPHLWIALRSTPLLISSMSYPWDDTLILTLKFSLSRLSSPWPWAACQHLIFVHMPHLQQPVPACVSNYFSATAHFTLYCMFKTSTEECKPHIKQLV